MVPLLGDLSALATAAALVVVSLGPLRPLVRSFLEPLPVLRDAAEQLAVHIPTAARFATPQHLWYRPDSIMAQWLPRTVGSRGSQRYSLPGLTAESSSTPRVGGAAERIDVDAPVPCRHGRAGRAIMTAAEAERPRFAITVDQPTQARIAIAWSPKWYGSLDCRPAVLQRTPEGLIQVDVPPGSSRIDLEFRADAWDRAGGTVTALLVPLVLFLRRRESDGPSAVRRTPDRPQDLG